MNRQSRVWFPPGYGAVVGNCTAVLPSPVQGYSRVSSLGMPACDDFPCACVASNAIFVWEGWKDAFVPGEVMEIDYVVNREEIEQTCAPGKRDTPLACGAPCCEGEDCYICVGRGKPNALVLRTTVM